MKVTSKGQVTIPLHIRELLGITQSSSVDFVNEKGKICLVVTNRKKRDTTRFSKARGIATTRMTTDEILALTRKSL